MKSRIGDCDDVIINCDRHANNFIDLEMDYSEFPDSKTRDMTINGHGKNLIDPCRSTGMLIANGRLGNDSSGDFTCYTYNEGSLVHYVLFQIPSTHFTVQPCMSGSMHTPLTFCIKSYNNENTFIN